MKKMKSRKSLALYTIIFILVFVLWGCGIPKESNTESEAPAIPINPLSETENRQKTNVRIYFQYEGERLLAGENRIIEVNESEGAEKSIIETMIKGPSADKAELTAIINPATKVLDIESQGEYLFVTLSHEFIQPFGDIGEMTAEEQLAIRKIQKFLAVYSITDTLLEQGTYSRINILVDDGNGARSLTLNEAGIAESDDITDPFAYNYDIILTPENTMREIMNDAEKKEWSALYSYIAAKTSSGQDKPAKDDFVNEMGAARFTVSNPQIKTGIVADDGTSALVIVNYEIKTQENDTREMTDIPIKLILENGVWKLTYNTLKSKFLTQ